VSGALRAPLTRTISSFAAEFLRLAQKFSSDRKSSTLLPQAKKRS
jgi:hypothetical protein